MVRVSESGGPTFGSVMRRTGIACCGLLRTTEWGWGGSRCQQQAHQRAASTTNDDRPPLSPKQLHPPKKEKIENLPMTPPLSRKPRYVPFGEAKYQAPAPKKMMPAAEGGGGLHNGDIVAVYYERLPSPPPHQFLNPPPSPPPQWGDSPPTHRRVEVQVCAPGHSDRHSHSAFTPPPPKPRPRLLLLPTPVPGPRGSLQLAHHSRLCGCALCCAPAPERRR